MKDPLQLRVLEAVGAGHRTLDALSSALGTPAVQVDERIRASIGQGLLVATQRGETWTFSLTDGGHRLIAVRRRLADVPGLSGVIGDLRSAQKRAGAPGSFGPAAAVLARAKRRPLATSSSILSPEQEAAQAERQSWSFAAGVVGSIAFVVLVIALLMAL